MVKVRGIKALNGSGKGKGTADGRRISKNIGGCRVGGKGKSKGGGKGKGLGRSK